MKKIHLATFCLFLLLVFPRETYAIIGNDLTQDIDQEHYSVKKRGSKRSHSTPLQPGLNIHGSFFTKISVADKEEPRATVEPGAPILFDQQSVVTTGLANDPTTGGITVKKGGNYLIFYSATLLKGRPLALRVNGTMIPAISEIRSTRFPTANFILSLKEGDILELINNAQPSESANVNLELYDGSSQDNVTATLTIIKLS